MIICRRGECNGKEAQGTARERKVKERTVALGDCELRVSGLLKRTVVTALSPQDS